MGRLAVSALLILVLLLVLLLPGPVRAQQPFRVTFIDVGQRDYAWLLFGQDNCSNRRFEKAEDQNAPSIPGYELFL